MAVGDASLAKDVIKLYAEGSRDLEAGERPQHVQVIGKDQQEDMKLNDTQRKVLNETLGDGVIQTDERQKLTGAGFSDEFVNNLSGPDGQAALAKRVTWLGEHVGSSIWGGPSVKDRFRNAMELKQASRELSDVSKLNSDVTDALGEGEKGTRELEKDLSKIAKIHEAPARETDKDEQARFDAIKQLGQLGTAEGSKAVLEAMKDPSMSLRMPEMIKLLENSPAPVRNKAIDKLVDLMENSQQPHLQQAAIATLNNISLKATNEESINSQVLWAHDHLQRFAQDPRRDPDLRFTSMVALANSGVSSIAPDLQAFVLKGAKPNCDPATKQKAETAQSALERMQAQLRASTLIDRGAGAVTTSGPAFIM